MRATAWIVTELMKIHNGITVGLNRGVVGAIGRDQIIREVEEKKNDVGEEHLSHVKAYVNKSSGFYFTYVLILMTSLRHELGPNHQITREV